MCCRVLGNRCLNDFAGAAGWFATGQIVDQFHAARHITPCGILTVEEGRIVKHDEELAVCAIGVHRACHRRNAAYMWFAAEFGRNIGQFRTASAVAGGAAALCHETVDHAVKDEAVVKTVLRKLHNLLNMLWRNVGAQADHHIAGFLTVIYGQCQRFSRHIIFSYSVTPVPAQPLQCDIVMQG